MIAITHRVKNSTTGKPPRALYRVTTPLHLMNSRHTRAGRPPRPSPQLLQSSISKNRDGGRVKELWGAGSRDPTPISTREYRPAGS